MKNNPSKIKYLIAIYILEELKTEKADSNGDREIRVTELKEYVTEKVQELTDGRQTPTLRQENLEFDFRVF